MIIPHYIVQSRQYLPFSERAHRKSLSSSSFHDHCPESLEPRGRSPRRRSCSTSWRSPRYDPSSLSPVRDAENIVDMRGDVVVYSLEDDEKENGHHRQMRMHIHEDQQDDDEQQVQQNTNRSFLLRGRRSKRYKKRVSLGGCSKHHSPVHCMNTHSNSQ